MWKYSLLLASILVTPAAQAMFDMPMNGGSADDIDMNSSGNVAMLSAGGDLSCSVSARSYDSASATFTAGSTLSSGSGTRCPAPKSKISYSDNGSAIAIWQEAVPTAR